MKSFKNIQRKDSECDGVVQKYTKNRVSAMESFKNIQRTDSECDGVVQKSWLIWCIK